MDPVVSSSSAPLQAVTPHDIRDELTIMVVNDLLGPAGGDEEELDQREDHAYGRYLVGLLAPKAVKVEGEEQDELATGQKDDVESGTTDRSTPPADTFFPNSIGLSFVVESDAKAILIRTNWGRYRRVKSEKQINPKTGAEALVWRREKLVGNDLPVSLKTGFFGPLMPSVAGTRQRGGRCRFGLMAFTRIESKGDFASATQEDDERGTALGRNPPEWLPVSEVRGEGIFLRFDEGALQQWETKLDVQRLDQRFLGAHASWRKLRKQNPPAAGYPGIRYVLIHSFAHALMRQISLECGYTAASVRERIYCKCKNDENGPMAGVLIYTAASDSEGTLGGLVQLGNPQSLGRLIEQALEEMRICGSDPLCAEHSPTGDGRGVHGACCHACLFAPETSCEKGNRFLDRTTLVGTFASEGCEFFT